MQSIQAPHTRTRERFSALYQVATGGSPVAVAKKLDRRHDTVTGWINKYNLSGPDSMVYRRTGGHPPFVE
ncbi:helix-turn-helix domain-containing protein [Endozoicomonas atrinae]|uniref:helix-turn-helix domain-containing protein n=1 Tax=Endozoicomonas atrinae TaxID=1333660 RepID=UPI001586B6C1|nr:helix-turn-helix domain-containing protein [Endozoicomonas atrinae]